MCWNAEVSIMTFIFSGTIGIYMWLRDWGEDRQVSPFLFAVAIMQFYEFFFWTGYVTSNAFPAAILLLQPLVLIQILVRFRRPFTLVVRLAVLILASDCVGIVLFYSSLSNYEATVFHPCGDPSSGKPAPRDSVYSSYISCKPFIHWFNNKPPGIDGVVFAHCFILAIVPVIAFPQTGRLHAGTVLFLGLLSAIYSSALASRWCLYSNMCSIVALFAPHMVSKYGHGSKMA